MGEILVLVEHRRGELRDVTFEMLDLAGRLARDAGLTVTSLLLADEAGERAEDLRIRSDRVLLVEDDGLAQFDADAWLPVVAGVVESRKPLLTLVGHTAAGMDLAPALAIRLGQPLATDCLEIAITDGALEVQRQVYGGKLHARLAMKRSDGYLLSIRPGCFSSEAAAGVPAPIERVPPAEQGPRRGRSFLEYVAARIEDVDIAAAPILVSAGRGVGKPDNLPVVQAFADAIGATLCCSRPVADQGWLPKGRQVGTSGKTVRPKLYVALGISGAYQHLAGMRGAETILAINKDPAAPIFEVAHYGIVADMFEVLPPLTKKLAER